ncbi:MAG: hypothetical protein A2831_03685 [Candidatus Yanofskybacteria bacterium RIFCSPHIGHO2_01_FULL_44_17]|uniref:Uncharacterized protein n=1 Tax=Candidatus Yanofskybacteria bacterium RIFCSPHIGHO2_01_FULL_44_17 TaxID=1802668 RepID=A0A1F8EY08_9BACT|nr:MAG: hypothetical protein A2831_03685 [Candidatus Yanofskybacteria bacterium RIFCSPHIGHO2_01_FULL_44_17]
MEPGDKTIKKEGTEILISISLKNGSETERIAQKMLEDLLAKYKLDKWIRCHDVLIEEGARAHAFPVVTISERKTEPSLLIGKRWRYRSNY